MPTPANALFWASLILGLSGEKPLYEPVILLNGWLLGGVMLALCALMLSSIPLPSLKFKHFRWQGNQVIYLLGGIGALLVAFYGILGVPLVMVLYILSPLWGRLFKTQDPKLKT